MTSATSTQWARLLKNQGTWVGSFTQVSPTGEILQDTPSEVALIPLNEGNTMRQEIRKRPLGQPPSETVLEYSSLGRGVLFCETGAFSQGSIQRSPVSEFGAELGLIHGSNRLRVAQIFPRQPTLGSLTLIREHLAGTEPTPRPALTVDQLLGTWVGEATTVFPDWQPQQSMATRLEIQRESDRVITQTLTFGNSPAIQSQGQLVGSTLRFEQGSQPVTVLLLPAGASATFPTEIQSGQPLFLEAGWLITPTLRQRLIRTYNAQGTWESLTLVTEQKL
ncbi:MULTISPECIES: DUF3598 family protein [Cyanophyceae]|uniref:DUF3598 family protein n=1 Tax=Cyanophyceae TaxID=3028117 RepID=UPI001684D595|nr:MULTISPECIES: DUF3598 family protein [Cyanophyceae]MBD1918123.1 DUF3598 family protein [Phormidium sp. FACHB-77]MBD2030155.1 DUF3598 family protein [Phormidium sp. FACHB-322]MBD2051473.1 DUF3598 family protein [Leptolyngbya sp. FACHB-60]